MVFSFVGGFDRGGVVLLLDYLEDLNKSIKKNRSGCLIWSFHESINLRLSGLIACNDSRTYLQANPSASVVSIFPAIIHPLRGFLRLLNLLFFFLGDCMGVLFSFVDEYISYFAV